MIDKQVICGLLRVIANVTHPESQKNAAGTLIYLLDKFPNVKNELKNKMGKNFIDLIDHRPDTFFRELNKDQMIYLKKNKINIGEPTRQRRVSAIQKLFQTNDENNKSKSEISEKLMKVDDDEDEYIENEEESDESKDKNNDLESKSDEFTEPSYCDDDEIIDDVDVVVKKKAVVNTKIYVPPEQIQIHSTLTSGKIVDYSKNKPYEKFEYNFSEFKKQNNDKINNRVKELSVDLLSDKQEKKSKYQEAYNMNFQKTKEKEMELIERTIGENLIEINSKTK